MNSEFNTEWCSGLSSKGWKEKEPKYSFILRGIGGPVHPGLFLGKGPCKNEVISKIRKPWNKLSRKQDAYKMN